jgi:hypothetical protein
MKTKIVKVKDYMTEEVFLIGKCEESDEWWMRKTGWGYPRDLLLIVHIQDGGGVRGCLSDFRGFIDYDLHEYGPLDVNRTNVKLVEYLKDKVFEDIPDEIDLTEV